MGSFFNMDGPFYRIGGFIADIFILSFLWFVFSILIIPMGAATTSLFYVTTRRISNKEGYLFRDFWKSFKTNFVQSTLVWLMILFLGSILVWNIMNISIVGKMGTIILPFQICFLIELVLVTIYIFPIIARFQMKMKDLIKTAFFMANKHLLTSVLCLIIGVVIVVATYVMPLLFLVGMSIFAFATSYFFMRIFKKYRPDLDADSDYATDFNNH